MIRSEDTVLILGGAGLVGFQIARGIAQEFCPERIIIGSLYQAEVEQAIEELNKEFPKITFEGVWGDIFLRAEFKGANRAELLNDLEKTRVLFRDVFWDKNEAYNHSFLAAIIKEFKPQVIVDSVNTATGISYQDIFTTSLEVENIIEQIESKDSREDLSVKFDMKKLENLLVSQSIPQLIRHIQILYDAMLEVGTQVYLKIGTTGTGGMGLNIPYTHSEDKPSSKLMTKTAVAFAHTGLLFLMARTPGGPIVKEIKPGALIGYRKVDYRIIKRDGKPSFVYKSKLESLSDELDISVRADFKPTVKLMMAGVDTGENGFFTLGEFEAITSLHQMEFVTPEEIAQNVVLEIKNANTGKDVIAAIDGAVMDPSYRAGCLRTPVIDKLKLLEKKTESHSVALGQLGPPELSKLLYEAHLLKLQFGTLQQVLDHTQDEISDRLYKLLQRNKDLANLITSIGIPILRPDGKSIYRGPKVNIPEYRGDYKIPVDNEKIDIWAQKGWVDLRPKNFEIWRQRFEQMLHSASAFSNEGSAAITLKTYLYPDIRIGEVVGWIFNNDPNIRGYRIKAL